MEAARVFESTKTLNRVGQKMGRLIGHFATGIALALLVISPSARACDERVADLISRLPNTKAMPGIIEGTVTSGEPRIHSNLLVAMKAYWLAQAGCLDRALSTGGDFEKKSLYIRMALNAPVRRELPPPRRQLERNAYDGWLGHFSRTGITDDCDAALVAALQRQYLRSMELADKGTCEHRSKVTYNKRSELLAWRYSVAGLYGVAASKGDGILFRELAERVGAHTSTYYMTTTPIILDLAMEGREAEARMVMIEDGGGGAFGARDWIEISHIAGPDANWAAWLELCLQRKYPVSGWEPLDDISMGFGYYQPSAARAWLDNHQAALPLWAQQVVIFGMVRGLLGLAPH